MSGNRSFLLEKLLLWDHGTHEDFLTLSWDPIRAANLRVERTRTSQDEINLGREISSFLVIDCNGCISQCLNCHQCATVWTTCPIDGIERAINPMNTDKSLDLMRGWLDPGSGTCHVGMKDIHVMRGDSPRWRLIYQAVLVGVKCLQNSFMKWAFRSTVRWRHELRRPNWATVELIIVAPMAIKILALQCVLM